MKAFWRNTADTRLVWQFYLYILLAGLSPSFGEYEYYYLTMVLGVSQWSYAMIALGASAFIVVAIIVYQFFKDLEVRSLFIIACVINCFTSFLSLVLARRWNESIGIPDAVFYWASDACFSQFVFAF